MRLDAYVCEQLPSLSRSAVQKIIEKGEVAVNGATQTKAGYKLKPNDEIKVNFDPSKQPLPAKIDLPVIYEDEDCVVINKPPGVLTHSKGAFNPEATVVTWLSDRLPDDMTGERAGIAHRLDRATSGVMICAKTPEALSWLQKQFSQRKVKKTYQAVVTGKMKEEQAIIDLPIERNPKKPQTFRVGTNGKKAQTAYRTLKINEKFSLLELNPTTGRTHQLRVHLSHLGHPILGDVLYGGHEASRLFLHARALELTLPNRQRKTFEAPVPPDFQEVFEP